MSDPQPRDQPGVPAAREMSTLTGTSRTLARAVQGLQMNATRLAALLAADAAGHPPASAGLVALADALAALTPADEDVVNAILSGRDRPKRRGK